MTTIEEDRALVEKLFPQLGTERFVRIGTGWTVDTHELDAGWIVQVAKTRFFVMPSHEVLYGLDGGGERFVEDGIAGIRFRADRVS